MSKNLIKKIFNKLIKILKPETKLEVKLNRKKLEELKKDFDELGYKFSNKDEIKKLFITLKNTNLSN